MTDAELNLVQLKELKRQLGSENRFIGEKICQNAIDCISNLVEARVMRKIAGIRWESRYSTTLKDDERGRWMRIGKINGMTVAIILKAKERFLIKLPNNRGDESLENCIIVTDLGQGMLEAEKYIAKYVSNFSA